MNDESVSAGSAAHLPPPEHAVALPLPSCMLQREDGLFVDLWRFDGSAAFRETLGQLFGTGVYFRGLDYAAFERLAFEYDVDAVRAAVKHAEDVGEPAQVRFADRAVSFEPARVALYKGVKVVRAEAFYLFEPLTLDLPPGGLPPVAAAAGESASDGNAALQPPVQKVHLDLDEFIAQMWLKGVRFGVDVQAVGRAIDEGFLGRLVVARDRVPVDGSDAGVQEVYDDLRRDNAPRVLAGGRVDLTQFSNRFPQIKTGTRLVRKVPMVPGVAGRRINGEPLVAPAVKDFELSSLAGPGIRIEADSGSQYLVAEADGFLNIDSQSNCFSVTEKIINREGVSVRTTGDLVLTGDEYEEHGEIQERRTVEGKTITVYADVFGRIVSSGGVVTLKKNLSGGAAINRDGPVIVEGLAANAFIHAPNGEVRVERAENCVIVGRSVRIGKQAVVCDILGDELQVAVAIGCAVAGKRIVIEVARPRGQSETLVSILIPDLSVLDYAIGAAQAQLDTLDEADAKLRTDMGSVRSHPEVAKYLMLMGKIRNQTLTLTAEQKPAFQKLGEKVEPMLKVMRTLSEQARLRQAERETLLQRIVEHEQAREVVCAGITCRVGLVEGDTVVRTLKVDPQSPALMNLPPAELRTRLRAAAQPGASLFDADQGEFAWCWSAAPS